LRTPKHPQKVEFDEDLAELLTLYLKAGAIEWPLLAILAPVLRGVTFEGSKNNYNSFLYIYI